MNGGCFIAFSFPLCRPHLLLGVNGRCTNVVTFPAKGMPVLNGFLFRPSVRRALLFQDQVRAESLLARSRTGRKESKRRWWAGHRGREARARETK